MTQLNLDPVHPTLRKPTFDNSDGSATVAICGSRIVDLYRQFKDLRELAQELNGRNPAEPLPKSVSVSLIKIEYSVDYRPREAKIKTVSRIGDIAPLLAKELEYVLEQIRQECLNAQSAAVAIEEACKQALYSDRAQANKGPT